MSIQIGSLSIVELNRNTVEITNQIVNKVSVITTDNGTALSLALELVTKQSGLNQEAFERSLDETCPGFIIEQKKAA